MADYKISLQEFALAIIVALMGFFFTLKGFILFMSGANPLFGFIIYESILFIILYVLGRSNLIIFKTFGEIRNITQVIGLYLITFAIFIPINWTSAYIQYAATGSFGSVTPIFYQSEDGMTWYMWSQIIPTASALAIEVVRILTYVVTPFLLVLLGGLLAKDRAEI